MGGAAMVDPAQWLVISQSMLGQMPKGLMPQQMFDASAKMAQDQMQLWTGVMQSFAAGATGGKVPAAPEPAALPKSDRRFADPAWRERILSWYSRPSNTALPRAGLQTPNAYGVQDLHGLVWEWTEDYSALLVDADNRNQGDADNQRFCGAGALSMDDRDNYAVLMRVAMLSSLGGADATANLGFRCARSAP